MLSDRILFKRLALHALTENPKSDIQHARKLLVAGRRPGIWEWELNREVLRFFRMAGRRLPRSLRAEIVRTIHNGPMTKSKKATYAEAKSIRGEKALRFCKLIASGARLDKKSRELVEEFDSNREAGLNERNEFLVWTDNLETMSAEEYIPKELLDSSVDDVTTVLENKKIGNYGFREFALRYPVKIASALRRIANRGAWPLTFWIDFLWTIAITHENPIHHARLRNYVAQVLTTAPAEVFTKVDSAAAVLIKRIAGEYGIAQEPELQVIWTKAWGGIGKMRTEVQNENDALTTALNHAAGMLAGAALIRLWKYEPRDGKGLPLPVRYYFDTISHDPSGRFGRVMLAANLSKLFAIDPEWVKKNLIPRLSLQSSEEARDLWSAHGRSKAFSHDLLLAFKSMFFQVLQDTEIDQRSKVDLVRLFMSICLERPKYLTPSEVRDVVRSVSRDALPIVVSGREPVVFRCTAGFRSGAMASTGPGAARFEPGRSESGSGGRILGVGDGFPGVRRGLRRLPPCGPPGFRGGRRSGGAFAPFRPQPLAVAQDPPEPVDVGGEDGEADRQLEPVPPAQPHPAEAAVLQAVDRRLHARMPAPRRREVRVGLADPVGGGQPALLRKGVHFQHRVELPAVLRAMEAAVEAAGPQVRERLQASPDQRDRDMRVAARPHDLVVEDEPAAVLDDAHRNPELDGLAGLALGDPPGVLLEDREQLLPVRDRLLLQHPAGDLERQSRHMADQPPDFRQGALRAARRPERPERALRLRGQLQRPGQERQDLLRAGAPPGRRVRPPVQLPRRVQVVVALPPAADARGARRPATPPARGSGPNPEAGRSRSDGGRPSPPRTGRSARPTLRQAFFPRPCAPSTRPDGPPPEEAPAPEARHCP